MRVHYYKSYNNLAFILLDDVKLFYTVIIIFITDILSARNLYIDKTSNFILIIINKLTKHITYIAINKNLNAKNFTDIL